MGGGERKGGEGLGGSGRKWVGSLFLGTFSLHSRRGLKSWANLPPPLARILQESSELKPNDNRTKLLSKEILIQPCKVFDYSSGHYL